jgi:hypothetical protein
MIENDPPLVKPFQGLLVVVDELTRVRRCAATLG